MATPPGQFIALQTYNAFKEILSGSDFGFLPTILVKYVMYECTTISHNFLILKLFHKSIILIFIKLKKDSYSLSNSNRSFSMSILFFQL